MFRNHKQMRLVRSRLKRLAVWIFMRSEPDDNAIMFRDPPLRFPRRHREICKTHLEFGPFEVRVRLIPEFCEGWIMIRRENDDFSGQCLPSDYSVESTSTQRFSLASQTYSRLTGSAMFLITAEMACWVTSADSVRSVLSV
jgi:hypothetical protein